jgi:hypothetical protein
MSIGRNRVRLERLEAQARARYVIGQDPDRDGKRLRELRSRSYHPGLTEEEAAEKAKLEATSPERNRDGTRHFNLKLLRHLRPLTEEEQTEYAELSKRFPPNPHPRFKELYQKLRAIVEGTDQVGPGDQAGAAKRTDSMPQKQMGSATYGPTADVKAKLEAASPKVASDAELLKQLILAANYNLVPGEGIEDVGPIKVMLECGIELDDVLYTLRGKVDPRASPKNRSLAAWSDSWFIGRVAETYGRRVMLPIIKEKLRALSGNKA